MTQPIHRVELQKQLLTFSAAHFITFTDASGNTICESIHGHNYAVRCIVEGPLNRDGYVVDFIALRDQLSAITKKMDHRVLLPTEHAQISVQSKEDAVTVRYEDRRWVFPVEDCLLLPISNTTAELLAGHIADQLISVKQSWGPESLMQLTIGVDENQGQWGEVQISL